MLDLHQGVYDLFAEAQLLGREYYSKLFGWGRVKFAVSCSTCGLTDADHARFGCRPPAPAAVVAPRIIKRVGPCPTCARPDWACKRWGCRPATIGP